MMTMIRRAERAARIRARSLTLSLSLSLVACDALSERPPVHADATIAPEEVVEITSTCTTDGDCDDQHDCTIDTCAQAEDGLMHCRWAIAAGTCFVNNTCAVANALREPGGCEVCDPERDPESWTEVADHAPCDDHSACTSDDTCSAGRCTGSRIDCEDDNNCTADLCDPATGCVYDPLSGYTCDDGLRCTTDDRCDTHGACTGDANGCDDGDPCTVDTCNEVEGCTHDVPTTLGCEDGDACTTNDVCADGTCTAGEPTNCDDGNSCTVDHCDPIAGCVHLPTLSPCCIGVDSVCDDRNPCTDDACDPISGACSYAANQAACDDGDPCTLDDVCAEQTCHGGRARPCDDFNSCTDDGCSASFPGYCFTTPRTGPDLACDDGIDCTTNDTCDGTHCVGDASECVCVPDLGTDGVKLTLLQVGTTGQPGDGLDVDQNPATCSPDNDCSGGVDNALSVIAGFANDPLKDGVDGGDITLVFEISSIAADPIEVSIFDAKPTDGSCQVQQQTCAWLVDPSFLDPVSCEPVAKIIAHLDGNRLVGGGPGTSLPFAIPLSDTASLEVVVANLRLEATITQQNGQVTSLVGILGGAVPKQTLIEGIQNAPEDSFGDISKEAILSLVDLLVVNDIDGNGDGVKDSASIGIKLDAIDAVIQGVQQ